MAIAVLIAVPIVAGIGAYHMVLREIPRRIMARVMTALSGRSGVNAFAHGKRPTAKARMVVRPAPDLIYSTVVYDLKGSPVRLHGPLPPGYWSLSLYAANSDNFFVLNDRELPARNFDVTLAHGDSAGSAATGSRMVACPGPRGIALIRMFVPNDGAIAAIEQAQQAFRVETAG